MNNAKFEFLSRILDEHDHLIKKFRDQISAKERSIDQMEKVRCACLLFLASKKHGLPAHSLCMRFEQ